VLPHGRWLEGHAAARNPAAISANSRSQADIASLFEKLQFLGVRIEMLGDLYHMTDITPLNPIVGASIAPFSVAFAKLNVAGGEETCPGGIGRTGNGRIDIMEF
jgi:hypothetical protein